MATGYPGVTKTQKNINTSYPSGTTVMYTVPSNVIFARMIINKLRGSLWDSGEGATITAQRLINGTWESLGDVINAESTISNSEPTRGAQFDQDSGLLVTYSTLANFSGTGGNFTILDLTSGDRVIIDVDTSGETAYVLGFVFEQSAVTSTI